MNIILHLIHYLFIIIKELLIIVLYEIDYFVICFKKNQIFNFNSYLESNSYEYKNIKYKIMINLKRDLFS